ncbi:unnamed protein product [Durusdinium trenchii]|uniref:N-acetyltransferase domain-containing protein n=1 Tax=Durusdinium trenchii TaxID=1381693 RepID=A0ABP0ICE4_9DINO
MRCLWKGACLILALLALRTHDLAHHAHDLAFSLCGAADHRRSPRVKLGCSTRIRPAEDGDMPWIAFTIAKMIMSPFGLSAPNFLVAVKEASPEDRVGFAQLRPLDLEDESSPLLLVNVEARGQGIGSALVRALLERRKTEQKRRVYALTLKNKLGFFERLQFREVSGDDLPEDLSLEVSLGRLIAPLAAGEPLIALLKHLERLEGLAEELHAHQPYLRAAKDAFSAPKAEDAKISGLPSSPHSVRHPADEKESPVVILQPRKDRSLFGSGLGRVPKEYMIKFLESAIDFVGAAATATGMSADVPTPPEEATAKATAKAMAAAKNAERLDGVAGRISSWLDVEVSDLVVWDPDPVWALIGCPKRARFGVGLVRLV